MFKKSLQKLTNAVHTAIQHNVDMTTTASSRIDDYKARQQEYFRTSVIAARVNLDKAAKELDDIARNDEDNKIIVAQLQGFIAELKGITDLVTLRSRLHGIATLYTKLVLPEKLDINIPVIPDAIRQDIIADLQELEKCFASGCYRSAVMLCGRLLEVALHRKYFDVTGNDALEKNPGIGLGTLIARLKDKKIEFDPGLTNQIHLINQVRVSSVHKKKQAFYPSHPQTKAIMLFTIDVLQKLFA